MKYLLFFIIFSVISIDISFSYQNLDSRDYTVMLNANAISGSSSGIELVWLPNNTHFKYDIYRKIAGTLDFPQIPLKTIDSGVYKYIDLTAQKGIRYEYNVKAYGKANSALGNPTQFYGYGYIEAGIEAPEVDNYGRVLLLVDESMFTPLKMEIERLILDMETEGWSVVTKLAPRAEAFDKNKVKETKQIILDEYQKDKSLNTIFLLGRIAVPYSGFSNTDGHDDHKGAWPADMYYGDMQENVWTDTKINDSSASRVVNRNISGDGKFDIDRLRSQSENYRIELAVGRVDLYNMPIFHKKEWSNPEAELLREYLNKDHAYRTGQWQDIPSKGVVSDNFKANGMPEGFASSGWRNIASICGKENVSLAPSDSILPWLNKNKYLIAYGTGPGSYGSCGGVGNTQGFQTNKIQAVFTMLFGSYFGDWDNQNNILRAPLCSQPNALTCCWDGRPHWFFHNMGFGKSIGNSVLISQNNYFNYLANRVFSQNQWVLYEAGITGRQMCFLGDPTLRIDSYVSESPKNLSIKQYSKGSVKLEWEDLMGASNLHYNVYRRFTETGPWVKLNNTPIVESSFMDNINNDTTIYYQVSTAKLHNTYTGSYYTFGRATQGKIKFSTEVKENIEFSASVYPNPASDYSTITINKSNSCELNISIYNQTGELVKTISNDFSNAGMQLFKWDLLDDLGKRAPYGVYFVKITSGDKIEMMKLIVQ